MPVRNVVNRKDAEMTFGAFLEYASKAPVNANMNGTGSSSCFTVSVSYSSYL